MARAKQEEGTSEEFNSPEITIQHHKQQLQDLPPSAKLVAKTLEEGEMSQHSIAEKSLLPERTVRYGLRRLEEQNIAASRTSLDDPRRNVYYLRVGDSR